MPKRTDIQSVLIIGAGPIIIGQACEFDYSGAQACKALKEEGYKVILVNSNPATIMTDPEMADVTYIEPITWKVVEKIIEKERPDVLLLEPKIFGDARGFFFESYNARTFAAATGLRPDFVQDNHARSSLSASTCGAYRRLHGPGAGLQSGRPGFARAEKRFPGRTNGVHRPRGPAGGRQRRGNSNTCGLGAGRNRRATAGNFAAPGGTAYLRAIPATRA